MTTAQPPVAVLGAGIAGLTAARRLRRAGIPVRVFEAGPKVAGLATSHHDADGFSFDTGAHFITNRLAAEIGVADDCRIVRRYGEAVWLRGKVYTYPFGLMRRPRYVADAVRARVHALRERDGGAITAADWFRAEYGRALADDVALPLLAEWSGAPADDLSAAVGAKLPGGVLETVWLKLAGIAMRRAVAIGYCNERPQSWRVWHVYPSNGVSTVCEHLANELQDSIELESPVEKVYVEGGRAVGVRVAGVDVGSAAVISTAPVHVLPKLVEGTDALYRFRSFRFRPMVFVNIKLEGRDLMPDVVTWVPADDVPFFRITEAPMSMPWLAPARKTLLTVDIGAEVGDRWWTMDEDELASLCVDHLEGILPDIHRRYLGARVIRTPLAYPVFLESYEADRRALQAGTGVDDLLSIGRNGEFAHILMEDVYWRTLRRVDAWLERRR